MKVWAIALALVSASCEKSGGAGKERGACYGNGTCDPGLVCLSDLCVRPPPADCGKVAEKLAGYRLGNYAPREERAKVIDELTATCEEARLGVDEGKCILEAKSRFDLAKCPRPLLDEFKGDKDGCKTVADRVAAFFVDAFAAEAGGRDKVEPIVPELRAAIGASCVEDLWPEAAKRCFTEASSLEALGDCQDAFPPELGERVEERLEPVIEGLLKKVMDQGATTPPPRLNPPPPTTPPATPPGATSVESLCAGYIALIERYAACDKVPQAARDSARQGIDAMRDAGKQAGTLPPEAQQAMADACKQAEDAMAQTMTAAGCP